MYLHGCADMSLLFVADEPLDELADGLQLLVGCFYLCMDELKSSTSLHG